MNAWESKGLAGLYDRAGKGRKPKLNDIQKAKVKEWAKQFPKNLMKVCALVKEEFGILVSKDTIKRILKELNFVWRRVKRKVKGKPDAKVYKEKERELKSLIHQHEEGQIDLRYIDESGFSLESYVPYAWQEKDNYIEVETSKSKRLNVLGLLNKDNDLDAYFIEGSVNSEIIIYCIDSFCKKLEKKTVLVIDNASIHTSKMFKEKIPEWNEKGLEVFYLPVYSPKLNLIEILWRFIKYEWIEFDAYKSWDDLVEYVENIIINYGQEYKINFA